MFSISVPGGGKNQQNLSELSPVLRGLSSLQEQERSHFDCFCVCTMMPLRSAHLPYSSTPTSICTYGAAEVASPSNGSYSSSSNDSSNGSSDGDSTSPAIIRPYLDAETTPFAAAVGFAPFDSNTTNQWYIKTVFKIRSHHRWSILLIHVFLEPQTRKIIARNHGSKKYHNSWS